MTQPDNSSSEEVIEEQECDHSHDIFSHDVDLDVEKTTLLSMYNEYITGSKPIAPLLTLFREDERVCHITRRALDPEKQEDGVFAVVEMLYMQPAVGASLGILSYVDQVQMTSGIKDCVVIAIFNARGSLTEAFPIVYDDEGNMSYDMDDLPDPDNPILDEFLGDALPVFVKVRGSAFSPTQLVKALTSKGHEIQFFDPYNFNTVDAICGY